MGGDAGDDDDDNNKEQGTGTIVWTKRKQRERERTTTMTLGGWFHQHTKRQAALLAEWQWLNCSAKSFSSGERIRYFSYIKRNTWCKDSGIASREVFYIMYKNTITNTCLLQIQCRLLLLRPLFYKFVLLFIYLLSQQIPNNWGINFDIKLFNRQISWKQRKLFALMDVICIFEILFSPAARVVLYQSEVNWMNLFSSAD